MCAAVISVLLPLGGLAKNFATFLGRWLQASTAETWSLASFRARS